MWLQAREGEEQPWRGLSEYFVDIGCHSNLQVAMYAMDALRQVRTAVRCFLCSVRGTVLLHDLTTWSRRNTPALHVPQAHQ